MVSMLGLPGYEIAVALVSPKSVDYGVKACFKRSNSARNERYGGYNPNRQGLVCFEASVLHSEASFWLIVTPRLVIIGCWDRP